LVGGVGHFALLSSNIHIYKFALFIFQSFLSVIHQILALILFKKRYCLEPRLGFVSSSHLITQIESQSNLSRMSMNLHTNMTYNEIYDETKQAILNASAEMFDGIRKSMNQMFDKIAEHKRETEDIIAEAKREREEATQREEEEKVAVNEEFEMLISNHSINHRVVKHHYYRKCTNSHWLLYSKQHHLYTETDLWWGWACSSLYNDTRGDFCTLNKDELDKLVCDTKDKRNKVIRYIEPEAYGTVEEIRKRFNLK